MAKISPKILLIIGSLLIILITTTAFVQLQQTGTVLGLPTPAKGTMYFEGSHQAAVQQPYTIKVSVDSLSKSVNSIGIKLFFDPEKLQINNISTADSFCQFYPEKKFDNQLGIVSLSCGSPHPGVKGKNQIIELTFMPIVIGTSTIRISDASKILLSDGKGTNILTEFPYWEVQIGASL